MNNNASAFSLVELSIVLVILGLLTGGILAGQNLIRAAELRSVSTEYSRYSGAANTFRDKYVGLPGDLNTATNYWGSAGGNGSNAACSTATGTGTQTCNGNGDGRVVDWTAVNEIFRFWQHLANAGFIEGTYTGVQGANTIDAVLGENAPLSKAGKGAGWSVYTLNGSNATASGNPTLFDGVYLNTFYFGRDLANTLTEGGILKPEEAWNIDTKMDDGKPAYGSVRTYRSSTSCVVSSAMNTDYALGTSATGCHLIFGGDGRF